MKVAIKYKLVAIAAAALAALMSLTAPAHAEELTGTLKKVHDDGLITLGVREASIPFSYSTGDQTVGYSQSIALAIVEEIRKTLAMPNLKVREVTITSANRFLMLVNNQIDLECGSTTHTRSGPRRQARRHHGGHVGRTARAAVEQ